jgi:bacteriocin-like protein
MKTEENKKQEELTDEQLDNVAGGDTSFRRSDGIPQ